MGNLILAVCAVFCKASEIVFATVVVVVTLRYMEVISWPM